MEHTDGERRLVEIALTEKHFLYLPILLAEQRKFYGFIPSKYLVKTVAPGAIGAENTTDSATFARLMSRQAVDSDVLFAVADPTVAFGYDESAVTQPAIIAAMITNAAFWAVNHLARNIKSVSDLSTFKTIFAYPEGSTSFAVATQIAKLAKANPPLIKEVRPKTELIGIDSADDTYLALSPDILGIEARTRGSASAFRIQMALSDTDEFSNMLVTALMTTKSVLKEHPDLVAGLLQALQLGIWEVSTRSERSISHAKTIFADEIKITGISEEDIDRERRDCIVTALAIAEDYKIFPSTIEVSRPQWMKALRLCIDAKSGIYSDSDATDAYNKLIQPHLSLARDAARIVLSPLLDEQNQGSVDLGTSYLSLAYFALGIILGCTLLFYVHWAVALAAIPVAFALAWGERTLGMEFGSVASRVYWFLAALSAVVAIVVFLNWPGPGETDRKLTLLGLGLAVFGVFAALVIGIISGRPHFASSQRIQSIVAGRK